MRKSERQKSVRDEHILAFTYCGKYVFFWGGGDGFWTYMFISLSSNQVFSSQYPAFHAGLEEALPIAIYV